MIGKYNLVQIYRLPNFVHYFPKYASKNQTKFGVWQGVNRYRQ